MNTILKNTVFGLALVAFSGAAFSMDFGGQRSGNPAHLVKGSTVVSGNTGKEIALNPGAYDHRSGAPIAKATVTGSAAKKSPFEVDATLSPGASMHRSGQA